MKKKKELLQVRYSHLLGTFYNALNKLKTARKHRAYGYGKNERQLENMKQQIKQLEKMQSLMNKEDLTIQRGMQQTLEREAWKLYTLAESYFDNIHKVALK